MSAETKQNGMDDVDEITLLKRERDELRARLSAIISRFDNFQCSCDLRERNSGHLSDCHVPAMEDDIEQARALIAGQPSKSVPDPLTEAATDALAWLEAHAQGKSYSLMPTSKAIAAILRAALERIK